MNVNVWDVTEPIQQLIRSGAQVDPEALADPPSRWPLADGCRRRRDRRDPGPPAPVRTGVSVAAPVEFTRGRQDQRRRREGGTGRGPDRRRRVRVPPAAQRGRRQPQGPLPLPRREVAVLPGQPEQGPLPLLRLPGGRRHHRLRDEDRPPLLLRDGRAPRRPGRHHPAVRGGRLQPRPPARRAHPPGRGAQDRRRSSTSEQLAPAPRPRSAASSSPSAASTRPPPSTSASATAPPGWDHLTRFLRGKGFTDKELILSGLAQEGRRGPIDRFRGRLMWPIRDIAGEVVGFGARKLLRRRQRPEVPQHPRDARSTRSPRSCTASTSPRRTSPRPAGPSSSRATPTSWPATWPVSPPPSRPAAPPSAATTSRSCAGC